MSFYKLSDLMFVSPYFSAMDCVRQLGKPIYCSSELTSGYRAYQAMETFGAKTTDELKRKFGDGWFKETIQVPNEKEAELFATSVLLEQTDKTPVINPGPLSVPGWGQNEYLAFWEELISTRVRAVRFNKKWEYSSGCTFEFAVAMKADIPALDVEGKEITLKSAIISIEAAISKLEAFDTKKLRVNLDRLTKHSIELRELGTTSKKILSKLRD